LIHPISYRISALAGVFTNKSNMLSSAVLIKRHNNGGYIHDCRLPSHASYSSSITLFFAAFVGVFTNKSNMLSSAVLAKRHNNWDYSRLPSHASRVLFL
jgi:hypothetical protein